MEQEEQKTEQMTEKKSHLFGMTLTELSAVAQQMGMPRFAAKQMSDWLYKKNVSDIAGMSNLSIKARTALAEHYDIGRTEPLATVTSADGTRKFLFDYEGHAVETAYIPDGHDERNTLCVSSQFGCKMHCLFCMTGRQGFGGNLTAGQILNQMASAPDWEELTNMVFMGMGEPMDNIDEVLKALSILTEPWGYAWSPRRITVSTIGMPKPLKRFLDESQAHLAISLHAPTAQKREELMPAQKGFPIAEVIELLRQYDWSGQRRLTFEYTIFEGVNDTAADAAELVRLLSSLRCRVNLIAFNPIPDTPLRGAKQKKMEWFRDQLNAKGLTATIRLSKGLDIAAACGLLSTQNKQKQGE